MAFNDQYQIAVGNNNAAGLTAIQSIVPSGNIAFPPPAAKGSKNPGIIRIRGDGTDYAGGYVSQIWTMVWLTYKQYDHAKTTWCAGGYKGLVTVKTQFNDAVFANYDAVLNIPTEDSLANNDMGWGYKPVDLLLTRLVAL